MCETRHSWAALIAHLHFFSRPQQAQKTVCLVGSFYEQPVLADKHRLMLKREKCNEEMIADPDKLGSRPRLGLLRASPRLTSSGRHRERGINRLRGRGIIGVESGPAPTR